MKWLGNIFVTFVLIFGFSGCTKDMGIYNQSDINKERNRAYKAEQKLKKFKQEQLKKERLEKEQLEKKKLEELKFTCNKRNTVSYTIATGSKTGTYYQIGKNLSKYVAQNACMNLKVLNSNGSVENVKRLAKEKGMKLAIVQSDVFQKFKDMAKNGNIQASDIVRKLRVVKPLYFEEAHFIVRAGVNTKYIQDIKDLKINIGPKGSGTAMTVSNIYKELYGSYIPMENKFTYGYKEALQRLLRGDLDVVVYVSGQPTGRLDMPQSAKNKIKLLEYNPSSSLQSSSYYQTDIKKDSYKWLDNNTNTLAVKSYLVTFNYKGSARKPLARFSKVLNDKFNTLQLNGHPKWKSVNKSLENLPGGWKYYNTSKFAYEYKNNGNCYGQALDLGLCK